MVAQLLHKPGIKKFERRKVYMRFKNNISDTDLAEMELLSSKNRKGKYLFCVKDSFTKYAWVGNLMDRKAKTVFNGLIKIVNESKREANKL